jgi:hypothetical protein
MEDDGNHEEDLLFSPLQFVGDLSDIEAVS